MDLRMSRQNFSLFYRTLSPVGPLPKKREKERELTWKSQNIDKWKNKAIRRVLRATRPDGPTYRAAYRVECTPLKRGDKKINKSMNIEINLLPLNALRLMHLAISNWLLVAASWRRIPLSRPDDKIHYHVLSPYLVPTLALFVENSFVSVAVFNYPVQIFLFGRSL